MTDAGWSRPLSQSHCSGSKAGISVIYDGDCPFCRAYIRLLRLRRSVGAVHLVDARSAPELVKALARAGYPLDAGMVVCVGANHYHGADAISVLALMSGRSGWFNRINHLVFGSQTASRLLYPLLARARLVLLLLLGRTPLDRGSL